MITIYAQLLDYREDSGNYVVYVFKDLNSKQLVSCVRLPNWDAPTIRLKDIGYLMFREVEAGKDFWFNKATNASIPYFYSGVYFINFVHERKNKSNVLTF